MSITKLASMKRVWLVPRDRVERLDDRVLLEFRDGVIAAYYELLLSFEEEESLMKSLREEHPLIGEVFFDGMPLEQFITIMRKAHVIDDLRSKMEKIKDEKFKTLLFDRSCTLWEQILEEEANAIKCFKK